MQLPPPTDLRDLLVLFGLEVLVIELALGLVLVCWLGPRVTRKLLKPQTEQAWAVIEPRLTAAVEAKLRDVLATLQPTPEQAAQARAELAATIRAEVEAAADGMAERLGKLGRQGFSQSGVDARTAKAAAEEEFLSAIAEHPQGGPLVAAAAEAFGARFPKVYGLAVRMGADGVPAFLEKHGRKLNALLPGSKEPDKPAVTVM